jgi:hypothetical protein
MTRRPFPPPETGWSPVGGSRRAARPRTRVLTTALLVGAVLAVAAPASADPAVPTHFRSVVEGMHTSGGTAAEVPVEVEVLGGDAFLLLRAAPGVRVEVPGYDGEPYLRFLPEGQVEVNERSPARWLNDERYGIEAIPALADATAPPDWRVVADDGAYAWHDHRIHFMSPRLPAGVDPAAGTAQHVFDWEVPMLVDGEPVVVTGSLEWVPGPSPLVPGALVVAGLAAAFVAARRWPALPSAVVGILVATASAVAGAWGLPPGAEADPALVVLPASAALLAALGRVRRPLVTAAGGLPLVAWALLQAGALTRPIVPGPLPTGVVRITVVVALAAGVATVAAGVRAWRAGGFVPGSGAR